MLFLVLSAAATDEEDTDTVEDDIGKSRDASRTDDEVVERYKAWYLGPDLQNILRFMWQSYDRRLIY